MGGKLGIVPYLLYTLLLAAFFASLIAIPYLEAEPGTSQTGKILFQLYKPMCHQLPQRSFFVFGAQMPVCARDAGIYGGMLLGAIAFPFLFRAREEKPFLLWLVSGAKSTKLLPMVILLAAMVPIGIDGGVQFVSGYFPLPFIGAYESTNLLRVLTGLLLGVVMSLYAIPLLNGLWEDLAEKPKHRKKSN